MSEYRISKIKLEFKNALENIWKYEVLKDYNNRFLYFEDSFKSRFYLHLTNRLGDNYFIENQVRLFTEFKVSGVKATKRSVKADLVLVDISCIPYKIIAIIELKYLDFKNKIENSPKIEEDYQKMEKYFNANCLLENVDLYMATISIGVNEDDFGLSRVKLKEGGGYYWDNKPFTELIYDFKYSDKNVNESEHVIYRWDYKSEEEKVYNYVSVNQNLCATCLSQIDNEDTGEWEKNLKSLVEKNSIGIREKNIKCCGFGDQGCKGENDSKVYYQNFESDR